MNTSFKCSTILSMKRMNKEERLRTPKKLNKPAQMNHLRTIGRHNDTVLIRSHSLALTQQKLITSSDHFIKTRKCNKNTFSICLSIGTRSRSFWMLCMIFLRAPFVTFNASNLRSSSAIISSYPICCNIWVYLCNRNDFNHIGTSADLTSSHNLNVAENKTFNYSSPSKFTRESSSEGDTCKDG